MLFRNRQFAPFVESFRCVLFFAFDTFIISEWRNELQLQSTFTLTSLHLQLIDLFVTFVRIFHLFSILIWICIYIRRVNTTKQFDTQFDKQILIHQCESQQNKSNQQIQYKLWQKSLIAFNLLLSVAIMWTVSALRYEECNEWITNWILITFQCLNCDFIL